MAGEIKHEWNGTVLTIISDSGASSADLGGPTGPRGAQGPAGISLGSGGSGNVDIDGGSLIYNEDGELEVSYGGSKKVLPPEDVFEWTGAVINNGTDIIDCSTATFNILQDVYDEDDAGVASLLTFTLSDGTDYEAEVEMDIERHGGPNKENVILFRGLADEDVPIEELYWFTDNTLLPIPRAGYETAVITSMNIVTLENYEYSKIDGNVIPVQARSPITVNRNGKLDFDTEAFMEMVEDDDIELKSFIETVIEEYLAANYPNL